LSSFFLKGLERLVERYFRRIMESAGYLHHSQHAFQQGRSTDTALHEITSIIEKTFSDKEFLLATFLDIEGAFDNVTFDAINSNIAECGANPRICSWIKSMLEHRDISYSHNGILVTIRATRGTPQGGVLSPLLWLAVMNSLLKKLNSHGFKTIGYADDLCICCRGKHLSTLSDRTQFALKLVEEWCREVGLRVNPGKSETIIYTKNRILSGYRSPILFGREIERKEEVKYLGVILDSKLNWRKHIEYRIKKCIKVFWCCRSAIGKTWGLSPKCLLWLYTAIVKPMLAYGAFSWWRGSLTAVARRQLNHLQRVAGLSITGAMSTTPQIALDTLLGLPKLEDFIEVEARKTAYRIRNQIKYDPFVRKSHSDALQDLFLMDKILEAPSDRLTKPVYTFDRSFEVLKAETRNDFFSHHEWAEFTFYTDGSVNDRGSGCGFVDINSNSSNSIPLGKYASVKQTELVAISHCAREILENNVQGNIAIFTDSLAALTALSEFSVKSGIVLDCYNTLQTIARRNPLRVVWIKAHSNIRGNDLADSAAQTATLLPSWGPEPTLPIDYSMARRLTALWLTKRSCQNWQLTNTCANTKFFVRQPETKITQQILSLNKSDARTSIGLLTGHAKVNHHLKKLNLRDDPDCRLCGRASETTAHLMGSCSSLDQIRSEVLGVDKVAPGQTPNIYKLLEMFRRACGENPSLRTIFN
ncbi:MAG: hypothetical protein EOO61_08560, partial [Hymenobacter sp.]